MISDNVKWLWWYLLQWPLIRSSVWWESCMFPVWHCVASEIHTPSAKITNSYLPPYYLMDGLPWINLYLIFNTHNSVKMLILQNTAGCRRDISTFLYYLMVWTKCKISIFWKHLVQADQHIFLLFLLHSKIKPSIRVLYCFCFMSYVCQGKGSPAVPILQLSLTSGGGWVK